MSNLVSIVLPVYNGEKHLAESIESIINQTYKDFELIIVNDCSTDSSERIILKYKKIDNRIVYIKNDINLKLPNSLNRGFAAANGSYLTWTSDDNIYYPNALENMVAFLEKRKDIGMVYCDYNVINELGNFCYSVRVDSADELIYRNIIGACFLYRSQIAQTVGEYNHEMFLVEDYDYWLRISVSYPIEPLHVCLYSYRIHEKSLTFSRAKEVEIALEKLHWKYLKIYEQNGIDENILCNYFDYIVPNKKKKLNRVLTKVKFSLKHRVYLLKQYNIIKGKLRKE